jgi:hypothetical protein
MDQLIKLPSFQVECANLLTMINGQTRLGNVETLMDHFEFIKQFDFDGAQGKVGLLRHKKTNQLVIYKTSLKVDYIIRHEQSIFDRLKGIRSWCPHFCEGFGLVKVPISHSDNRKYDPFTREEGAKIYTDVILSEYIPGSKGLTSRISSLNTRRIFSSIRQVLTAIEIGYREYGLVHYDLHTDNILMIECPEKAIFLYNLKERQICIPTHGVVPVIIDYGFAYTKGSTNPLFTSMGFTDAGYLACVADPYYDARIFLVNAADEMNAKDRDKYGSFYQDIKNLYKGLNYNPSKGWDEYGQYSASEMIEYTIEEVEKQDHLSKEIENNTAVYTLMFQSLISLPLVNKENGNFRPFYIQTVREFSKFENTVRTSFSKKFLMYNIIDMARKYKDLFYKDKYTAIKEFRRELSEQIALSFKFYIPPEDVDYHALLTGLYEMAKCIGTIYYRVMKRAIEDRKIRYGKTVLKNNLEIHDFIESKYTTEYYLSEDTPVYVWDTIGKTSLIVNKFTAEECQQFNKLDISSRAKWLWDNLISRDNVLV